jgi:hypothetical protein
MANQIINVTFTNPDNSICESVVIIYKDGSQVSMLKSVYETLASESAKELTESVTE